MKTFVETLSSSDECDEIMEVPYVKPTPPVIVLSCSEEEDDEVSISKEVGARTINGSQPSHTEGRGQTDSLQSSKTPRQKRKDPEKEKSGGSKGKSSRASGSSDRNVEPDSVRSSENASETPPGSDETSLPMIRISNNIFDPSNTALGDSTDPVDEPIPVPRFVANPVGGPASKAKRVPSPEGQPPKKRTRATTSRSKRAGDQEPAAATASKASESSFVSFLRSINLPIPTQFLSTEKEKPKRKGRGPAKKGKAAEVPDATTQLQTDDPAGRVIITQETSPAKKVKGPKKGTPSKKNFPTSAVVAFPIDDEAPLTQADLASVNIDIQHNIVNPEAETPKTSKKKTLKDRKSKDAAKETSPGLVETPKKRKQRENDSTPQTPASAKRRRKEKENQTTPTPENPRDDCSPTPDCAIPSTWTKEMRDFYCTPDKPDFELEDVLTRIPAQKKKWKANLDDGSRSRPLTAQQRKQRYQRCENCKQHGHLKNNCPEKPRGKVCILCGEAGHLSIEGRCSSDRNICLNCGHRTLKKTQNACDRCIWRSHPVECSLCRMKGHLEPSCPDHWRRYHCTTVDVPELLRRREKLQEDIEQKKLEIEQIDVATADESVKKAEENVAAKQKKVIGPKLTYKKKLEKVEAAEKELQKALGRRRKILKTIQAGQDWIKEMETIVQDLESQITSEGPEVVDVESDQINDSGKQGFKYKPRYQQSCSNCGHKGHNYFLCKAPRMKTPAYFPNKPFVIQELQALSVDLTKPLVVVATIATEPATIRENRNTVINPVAVRNVISNSIAKTKIAVTNQVTNRTDPGTKEKSVVTSRQETAVIFGDVVTTPVTKQASKKTVPKIVQPATVTSNSNDDSSPAPELLLKEKGNTDTSSNASGVNIDWKSETRNFVFPTSNTFGFLNGIKLFPPVESTFSDSSFLLSNASNPGTSCGSAQRSQYISSSHYFNDDTIIPYTPFDKPIQPQALIQTPEGFNPFSLPPPSLLQRPPPPINSRLTKWGPPLNHAPAATPATGTHESGLYSSNSSHGPRTEVDFSSQAPGISSASMHNNGALARQATQVRAEDAPSISTLQNQPVVEERSIESNLSVDVSLVSDSAAEDNTEKTLPGSGSGETGHGEVSPPPEAAKDKYDAPPTPTDCSVTSTSELPVSTGVDLNESGARYIPVPVPIPIPAKEYEALLKAGLQNFAATSQNYTSALMTNPEFLSEFRKHCQAFVSKTTTITAPPTEQPPTSLAESITVSPPPNSPPEEDFASDKDIVQTGSDSDTGPGCVSPGAGSPNDVELVGHVVEPPQWLEPMGTAQKEADTLKMPISRSDWLVLANSVREVTMINKRHKVHTTYFKEEMCVNITGTSETNRKLARDDLQSWLSRKSRSDEDSKTEPINDIASTDEDGTDVEVIEHSLNVSLLPSEWDLFSAEQDELVKLLSPGLGIRLFLCKDDKSVTVTGADKPRCELAKQNIVKFLQSKAADVPFAVDYILGEHSGQQHDHQNNQRSNNALQISGRSREERERRSSPSRSSHRDRDGEATRRSGHPRESPEEDRHGQSGRRDDYPRHYSDRYYNRYDNRRYNHRQHWDSRPGESRDRDTNTDHRYPRNPRYSRRLASESPRPHRPPRYFDQRLDQTNTK